MDTESSGRSWSVLAILCVVGQRTSTLTSQYQMALSLDFYAAEENVGDRGQKWCLRGSVQHL